jgi:hypothetical protein
MIVKIKGKTLSLIRTTDGVKQGVVLSPYLFIFFMKSFNLLQEIFDSNVGALISNVNVTVSSNSDGIILLASVLSKND